MRACECVCTHNVLSASVLWEVWNSSATGAVNLPRTHSGSLGTTLNTTLPWKEPNLLGEMLAPRLWQEKNMHNELFCMNPYWYKQTHEWTTRMKEKAFLAECKRVNLQVFRSMYLRKTIGWLLNYLSVLIFFHLDSCMYVGLIFKPFKIIFGRRHFINYKWIK